MGQTVAEKGISFFAFYAFIIPWTYWKFHIVKSASAAHLIVLTLCLDFSIFVFQTSWDMSAKIQKQHIYIIAINIYITAIDSI